MQAQGLSGREQRCCSYQWHHRSRDNSISITLKSPYVLVTHLDMSSARAFRDAATTLSGSTCGITHDTDCP